MHQLRTSSLSNEKLDRAYKGKSVLVEIRLRRYSNNLSQTYTQETQPSLLQTEPIDGREDIRYTSEREV